MDTAPAGLSPAGSIDDYAVYSSSEPEDDLPDLRYSADALSFVVDTPEEHRAHTVHGFGALVSSHVRDGFQRIRTIWSRDHEADTGSLAEHLLSDERDDRARLGGVASFIRALRTMLLSSWLNGLLIFVPIGIGTYVLDMGPLLIFASNVIAIVPLSSLLSDATEGIASDAGDTIGALLNISLGNLVELILFVVALVNDQIRIVQTSILGSILVNLLLILGSALLATGRSDREPIYNTAETQLLACLLFVSVFVFLMPTAFNFTFDHADGADEAILKMSRISALMVLLIYVLYFVHELRTHPFVLEDIDAESFDAESRHSTTVDPQEVQELVRNYTVGSPVLPPRTIRFADEGAENPLGSATYKTPNRIELGSIATNASETDDDDDEDNIEDRGRKSQDIDTVGSRPSSYQSFSRPRGHSRSVSLGSGRGHLSRDSSLAVGDRRGLMRSGLATLPILRDSRTSLDMIGYEQKVPRRSMGDKVASVVVLAATSLFMSMCAEFLVSTIDEVTHQGHLSESVIGLIILPIAGNIAEYVTVVRVAAKDKLDLGIAVAVGSSIQIALCVAPLTVIAGWILGRNLALTFNFFEMATLVGTALLVNLLILNDGSSTPRTSGLKGALMCACYVIIGLGAYLSPEPKG